VILPLRYEVPKEAMQPDSRSSPRVAQQVKRALLLTAGFLALGLGLIGIVIPILPTTPFILLAAICFARSSPRFHAWLLGNRVFGRHLEDYLSGRGVSPWVKAGTLTLLWVVTGMSMAFFVTVLWGRILLGIVIVGVSAHLLMVRNRRPDADSVS